jgi:hypothetical protein
MCLKPRRDSPIGRLAFSGKATTTAKTFRWSCRKAQRQIQRRPPEKAGGRCKFNNNIKGKRAGGTPALRIQPRRQRRSELRSTLDAQPGVAVLREAVLGTANGLSLGIVFFDDGEVGGDLQVHNQLELVFYLEKADGYDGGEGFLHRGVVFFAEGHAFLVELDGLLG